MFFFFSLFCRLNICHDIEILELNVPECVFGFAVFEKSVCCMFTDWVPVIVYFCLFFFSEGKNDPQMSV